MFGSGGTQPLIQGAQGAAQGVASRPPQLGFLQQARSGAFQPTNLRGGQSTPGISPQPRFGGMGTMLGTGSGQDLKTLIGQ